MSDTYKNFAEKLENAGLEANRVWIQEDPHTKNSFEMVRITDNDTGNSKMFLIYVMRDDGNTYFEIYPPCHRAERHPKRH